MITPKRAGLSGVCVAVMGCIVALVPQRALAKEICTAAESDSTEKALGDFAIPKDGDHAWSKFKQLVEDHGKCDDGSHGEMFDSLTMDMLTTHWAAALRYEPLMADTYFARFIILRINGTSSQDEVRRLRSKAITKCNFIKAKAFCRSIRLACDRFLGAGQVR
jgi:hypothetical protein